MTTGSGTAVWKRDMYGKNRLHFAYWLCAIGVEVRIAMMVNTNNIVSITEANQNFSRVARMVDENGPAVILKNNTPRYILIEFSQAEMEQTMPDEDVMIISRRIMARNREAYEVLAR